MDDTSTTYLRIVAIQLALVVAAIHVFRGLPDLLVYLNAGTMPDPRPAIFVVSSVALLLATLGLLAPVPQRPLYAFILLVSVAYALGYVQWHIGGHGSVIPGFQGYGEHTAHPVETVVSHLLDDPLALVSMIAELLLAGVLGILLIGDE